MMVAAFKERLKEINPGFTRFDALRTLQVNVGDLCNQSCTHCHVNASPQGTRVMSPHIMGKIAAFLSRHRNISLDITGGCPEMNPHFRSFVEETAGLSPRRTVRSNLTIITEPGMAWLPAFYREQQLVVVASLPCYLEENVNRQRGAGTFARSIAALRLLNKAGYGTDLELDLVYNPGGNFLPGSQKELEVAYKTELLERYGIVFSNLFTITNAPIGRFKEQLVAQGAYERYLQLLAMSFNPETAGNIMCRTLLSVDWQGLLYNCDFNQAVGLPVTGRDGRALRIDDLEEATANDTEIFLDQHCYCCTAGEGSSCTGALAERG
ncbi:MAG TPA: arsenosugar biosynthesis radical SAM (seleno)protein ArsS [Geobacteraceae bacterium]